MTAVRSFTALVLTVAWLYVLYRIVIAAIPIDRRDRSRPKPPAVPSVATELEDGTFKLSHVCDESCQEALERADVEAHS